jgi:transposase-like protein
MNPVLESKLLEELLEEIIVNGTEAILPVMQLLLNFAMKQERSQYLKAEPYERSADREGYANGYKPKTLQTRMGSMTVKIPQVRGMSFYPSSLEKGCRSERALKLAIAEMYVKGVSTRKVAEVTEALCGLDISSTQVSRLSKRMDEELEAFRRRPLGSYAYLDARYEHVRHGGIVRDVAVLIAIGANPGKARELLGISVSLSEAEVHWREFMEDLRTRGLKGTELIISDDHSGLKAARKAVFTTTPWQRCQFHMQQNAQSYIPKKRLKKVLAAELRSIFNAPSRADALELKRRTLKKYEKIAPDWCKWLDNNIEEGLTFFEFPPSHWRKIRTTNGLERLNREIARRTRVATLFPNVKSCLRLVTAVALEIHDDWCAGRAYLSIPDVDENSELPIYRKNVA